MVWNGNQKKLCVSDVHFAVLLNRTSFHQTWVRARFKDSFPIFTATPPLSQKHVKNRRFIDRFPTVATKLEVSTSVAVDDVYGKNKERVHEIQCICNDMPYEKKLTGQFRMSYISKQHPCKNKKSVLSFRLLVRKNLLLSESCRITLMTTKTYLTLLHEK